MIIHYQTVQVVDNARTAQELRLARMSHSFTQEDIAKVMGVSRSFITQLETGQRDFSVYFAERLKRYFDSLDYAPLRPTPRD